MAKYKSASIDVDGFNSSDSSLSFNKDLACLQEMQRMENYYNNFRIYKMYAEAYECLYNLYSIFSGKISESERGEIKLLFAKCKSASKDRSGVTKVNYNDEKLRELNMVLHDLMIKYKIHLRDTDSGNEALRI